MADDIARIRHELLEGEPPAPVADILASPRCVPDAFGIYAWYFSDDLPDVPREGCRSRNGLALLYLGIAPGRPASSRTLRDRIVGNHCRGNAGSSTLRRSLGALLRQRLGLRMKRGTSSGSDNWSDGEDRLTAWLSQHAAVSWVTHSAPWSLEGAMLEGLRCPMNLAGNRRESFRPTLKEHRRQARAEGCPRR